MRDSRRGFPFLFGRAFIEAFVRRCVPRQRGLQFPFLFGRAFIEAFGIELHEMRCIVFPFLFGGTFIEGDIADSAADLLKNISLPIWRDFH